MITQLELTHFRNWLGREFVFPKDITVFLGPNAVGKTNILEAVFLLATGKSFRADEDTEMIEWDQEMGRVKAAIYSSNNNEVIELEIVLTQGAVMGVKTPIKKFLVNGVSKRMVDFIGHLRCVLFWPEDLELVIGAPVLRRRYLDFVLTQTDWEYRRSLLSYEKGLRQRNRLLLRIRDEGASYTQLTFWDQLLIKDGSYLTRKREAYLEFVNARGKPFGDFKVVYDPSVISEVRLDQYKEAELAAAATLVGPHRDDFNFLEKGRDVSKFGSRGEQRLIVLWLKMAELEYIKYTTGSRPVLLLDDIFSELDHTHREEILKIVSQQQTIITTADQHFLPEKLLKSAEVIELARKE